MGARRNRISMSSTPFEVLEIRISQLQRGVNRSGELSARERRRLFGQNDHRRTRKRKFPAVFVNYVQLRDVPTRRKLGQLRLELERHDTAATIRCAVETDWGAFKRFASAVKQNKICGDAWLLRFLGHSRVIHLKVDVEILVLTKNACDVGGQLLPVVHQRMMH